MATLERIRSKAGVLVAVIIGLSLLAFILTDLLDSRKSIFTGKQNEVAQIGGNSISYKELEKEINDLTETYKLQSQKGTVDEKTLDGIREQAWNTIVNKNVEDNEYDELGITVSSDELFDLVQGTNPHPIILQLFTDQETGQFNKAALIQFLKNLDNKDNERRAEQKTYWLAVEKEITTQELNEKYISLISKGLSAPKFMAKNDFIENNRKAFVSYIEERFSAISDSAVKFSESDLKDYYESHKYLYKQDKVSRDLEYVAFDIVASETDQKEGFDWITKIKQEFTDNNEAVAFVNANSDASYIDKNYKPGDLPDSLNAFAFNAKVGDVYGPYVDGESYKLAKLFKVLSLPDSVKARHILIRPKGQTEEAVKAAKALADSLKLVLAKDNGASFEALAKQFSDDKSNAEKGGDLGWFADGSMVKPFNDTAFNAKKGEIKLVETQFGYHILQVTDKGTPITKVKVAILEHKVIPSSQTINDIHSKAVKLASESSNYETFKTAVAKQNLSKRSISITEGDRTISGINSPIELIRWAFQADADQVSEPIDLKDAYTIAVLTRIHKKGYAPFQFVKNEIEVAVRKQKKAEKLSAQIMAAKNGASSIQVLAQKLNLTVESAPNVSFTSYTIGNAGFEPKVVAIASNIERGKISDPIEGNTGVFVVVADTVFDAPQSDYLGSQSRLNYSFQSRASYESRNALIKMANIEDKRYKFY